MARYKSLAAFVATALLAVVSPPSAARSAGAPVGTLTVRVVDSVALPLPATIVTTKAWLGGKVVKAATDRDGVVAIDGLPEGTYRVDAALPSFDVSRTSVRVGVDHTSIEMRLQVRMLCECVDVRVPIEPAVVVQGRVIDDTGQPLPHAMVHAVDAGFNENSVTDSDGAFEARVPRGRTVALEASYPGFKSEMASLSTARPASQSLSIVLHPGAAQPAPATDVVERLKLGCVCPGNLFVHPIK